MSRATRTATRSTCAVEDFFAVRDALEAKLRRAPRARKLRMVAATHHRARRGQAAGVLKLIDALDDNDDVQNVYANFEVSDAVCERLSA